MKVFQRLIDVAAMNSCFLWASDNSFSGSYHANHFRHRLLAKLAEELIGPQRERHLAKSRWENDYYRQISRLESELHLKHTPMKERVAKLGEKSTGNKKMSCEACLLNNKPAHNCVTKVVCGKCRLPICTEHRPNARITAKNPVHYCFKCANKA